MGVKQEAKELILNIFGPSSAQKVDEFDDSDPKIFLDNVKDLIVSVLGESIAKEKLAGLYKKYAPSKA